MREHIRICVQKQKLTCSGLYIMNIPKDYDILNSERALMLRYANYPFIPLLLFSISNYISRKLQITKILNL
jgi:hypothetical protein